MSENKSVTIATVDVNSAGRAGLEEKIEKLNKRARRHGMVEVTMMVVREYQAKAGDTDFEEDRFEIEINGCEPCIDGWRLGARVEFNDLVGTIVHVVPGKNADRDYSAYREHNGHCDHCNSLRRRNDVFVLIDDDGNEKVVGRNCLADFIRCGDAETFARYAEFCEAAANWTGDDLEDCGYEGGFGGGNGHPPCEVVRFLSVVSVCTRKLGWTSRTAAKDNPGLTATANDAYYVLFGRRDQYWREFVNRNDLHVEAKDIENAEAAAEWACNLSDEDVNRSEYLNTIRTIALAGQTDYRLAGYTASIIRAKQNDEDRQRERAERDANKPEKVWIGCEGKRFKGQRVRVVRVRYYENDWGVKTIVAMEADVADGKVAKITWFATGEKDYEEGCEYNLDATVKEHKDDPKWGKETVVTRGKLVSREGIVA